MYTAEKLPTNFQGIYFHMTLLLQVEAFYELEAIKME